MTLFRQLLMMIVVILSLVLIAVMGINFNTTKGYLVNQLASTAQDSATSLSMSLSGYMADKDKASIVSTVNAVFDSGYFSEVRVHFYADNSDLIRKNETKIVGVPQWFIHLIDFNVPVANAVVSNGWNELGQVYITGSAGYGYYQLWLATRDLLLSFIVIGLVMVVLGWLGLRWLFKPLSEVEKQAEAIQQRRFLKMTKIPKTRELKSVVLSMNRMAEKLEKEFEAEAKAVQWLQSKAFQDPVSGLGNRHFFDRQAKAYFASNDRTMDGIALISLTDLAKLNNERGYEAADLFIRSAAQILTGKVMSLPSAATVARLSGADFVILIPNVDQDRLKYLVNDMMESLLELVTSKISYSDAVANIGAVIITGDVDVSSAMAQADAALREAKMSGMNSSRVFDSKTGQEMAIARIEWREMLEHAIENRAFTLRKQRVALFEGELGTLHEEVFSSLEYEGKQYHAGYFIGLAEQFDLGDQVDQVIIERVIAYIKVRQDSLTSPLAVNISASAFIKPSFIDWLNETLKGLDEQLRHFLVFEISEQSVLASEDYAFDLSQMLKHHGVIFGIDNVGKQFSAFHYLQVLMPDYVKVDPSYTKLVAGRESESFFMQTLCKMFNSLNIQVIATGIESVNQLSILQRFDVAGGQGYAIGLPSDM
ncbi:RNase E specificity factor CsrD [Marinomonas spartinae]|uniref:bifunctional diguanylate cyclase/phosphodiesterase n=1 Tax=Marinomonas spartinae TaxID=1792290 RepID=UPI000808D94C|nr:EAL domain-containing protein [Marinomonas spartinae]SBS33738.1 RNase E specificity factor CsrD [Marinomonas spartinae]